jgi:NhaA family Na+:H+ antiporter
MRLGDVAAVGALGGIGFTVAIFITDLAYNDPSYIDAARTGVLLGSIVSAVVGATMLTVTSRWRSDRP